MSRFTFFPQCLEEMDGEERDLRKLKIYMNQEGTFLSEDLIISVLPENASKFIGNYWLTHEDLTSQQMRLVESIISKASNLEELLIEEINPGNLMSDNFDVMGYNPNIRNHQQSLFSFHSAFYVLRERLDYLYTIASSLCSDYMGESLIFEELKDTLYKQKPVLRSYIETVAKKVFSQKLSALLKDRGVNQNELAFAIGVSKSTVSAWHKGLMQASMDNLVAIAIYLNTTTDYLLRSDIPLDSIVEQTKQDDMQEECTCGLTKESIEIMEVIKEDPKLITTLNMIISNCKPDDHFCTNSRYDILTALAKCLQSDYATYTITQTDIEDLQNTLKGMSSVEYVAKDFMGIMKRITMWSENTANQYPDIVQILNNINNELLNSI